MAQSVSLKVLSSHESTLDQGKVYEFSQPIKDDAVLDHLGQVKKVDTVNILIRRGKFNSRYERITVPDEKGNYYLLNDPQK